VAVAVAVMITQPEMHLVDQVVVDMAEETQVMVALVALIPVVVAVVLAVVTPLRVLLVLVDQAL
jgi:hypothetical protein